MNKEEFEKAYFPIDLATARQHKDVGTSFIKICNNDLLYLVDHCYNVIGDERLKTVCDRLLLSALTH